jgi:diguanylate cyclase (GGDEF)-like protein
MNDALVKKIQQCPALPSLPAVALQVLDLAQRDDADISEIAKVISKDPAISSKILKTVNSSFYGRSQSIGNLNQALVVLGLQSVRTLVLGFSLVSNLKQQKPGGFNHLAYWRRSVYAATAARVIAKRVGLVQQEECFLVALLMDLGMLAMDQVLGEEYGQVCAQATSHHDLLKHEQETLGMTHAEAAGILADHWKLPPVLSEPMRHHHEPQNIKDPAVEKMAEVVRISCRCADVFVDEEAAESISHVRRLCAFSYKMSEADADALLKEIGQYTSEVASLFEIRLGAGNNYDSILKKANEALVELSLRSQQQASGLVEQNKKLQTLATRDKLTGLANRRHFDEVIQQQVEDAIKNSRPLSMLMIDLDRFKSVNDSHGHPSGDLVLSATGKVLISAARNSDLPARYGGEELVLLMPDTSRATATATAEKIRRVIASLVIRSERIQIPVTASIGVATLEPGGAMSEPAHLLKAADMALYAAKQGGRNCVRVFSLKATAA